MGKVILLPTRPIEEDDPLLNLAACRQVHHIEKVMIYEFHTLDIAFSNDLLPRVET